MKNTVKALLAAIDKFNAASDGDSGDEEHDAAIEMRDAAEALAAPAPARLMVNLAPMDWELLRSQKRLLVEVRTGEVVSEAQNEMAEGLLSLLDTIQDQAVNTGQATEREVFNTATKTTPLQLAARREWIKEVIKESDLARDNGFTDPEEPMRYLAVERSTAGAVWAFNYDSLEDIAVNLDISDTSRTGAEVWDLDTRKKYEPVTKTTGFMRFDAETGAEHIRL